MSKQRKSGLAVLGLCLCMLSGVIFLPDMIHAADKPEVSKQSQRLNRPVNVTASTPGGNVYNTTTLATALGNDNATINGNTVILNKHVSLDSYVLFYNTLLVLDLNGYTLGSHMEL